MGEAQRLLLLTGVCPEREEHMNWGVMTHSINLVLDRLDQLTEQLRRVADVMERLEEAFEGETEDE